MSNDLEEGLAHLLARFRSELAYNDAKGNGPYRQGMHDGLHFAADALADVLAAHQIPLNRQPATASGTIPPEYGV
jgi:hypothetical protein